jgi:xeroderma pigmentosum group C-complementing protein
LSPFASDKISCWLALMIYEIIQAYKDHHLYALEKWLHKNQILHPKGPVLGFCKGHPVYPRSCVQTLQSRHGWLREGLQIRENELPAKVHNSSTDF